jgi:hypothetical protein
MKEIILRVIPISKMRYKTLGDYFQTAPGYWIVTAAQLPNPSHSALILIHELIELISTQHARIPEPKILKFDLQFEKNNPGNNLEPGDSPLAPYHKQHQFSENIEHQLARFLHINWNSYNQSLNSLWKNQNQKSAKTTPNLQNLKPTKTPATKASPKKI